MRHSGSESPFLNLEWAAVRLAVGLVAALLAPSSAGSEGPVPQFEDYPAPAAYRGNPAPIKFSRPAERLFRSRLLEAARQPPNFAGHLVFAGWGCGSQCAAGAFVDLHTGKVIPPPMRWGEKGWDRWNYCGMPAAKVIDFRIDSRLVKFECGLQGDEYLPDKDYFVFEEGEFREILHVPGNPHWREYTNQAR